jgi:hypothetical protein
MVEEEKAKEMRMEAYQRMLGDYAIVKASTMTLD